MSSENDIKSKSWTKTSDFKRPESKPKKKDFSKKTRVNRCPGCGTNLKEFPCLECKINGPH